MYTSKDIPTTMQMYSGFFANLQRAFGKSKRIQNRKKDEVHSDVNTLMISLLTYTTGKNMVYYLLPILSYWCLLHLLFDQVVWVETVTQGMSRST